MKEGKIGIYDIAEICRFHGVKTAILCPGSRCAPLTLAFSRTAGIECLSIVDERSAAFIALGIAESSKSPVVLVCTSGSAVLNFGPALAEAFYRHIPLIVLTADRPQRLVGQHDGQTMNQPNVFANFIKESFNIVGDISTDNELAYLHRTINAALIKSKSTLGPVHVNISFEEPLYTLIESTSPARFISYIGNKPDLKNSIEESFSAEIKCIILPGSRKYDEQENALLFQLSKYIPVISESISNFSGNVSNANEIIRFLSDDKKEKLVPDVLVTFGEGIISKSLKNFIRTHKPKRHIHIDVHAEVIDTYQCLTDVYAVTLEKFCTELLSHLTRITKTNEAYMSSWKSAFHKTADRVERLIQQAEFGDLKVMDYVTRRIPKGVIVHVANSMPVRYLNICSDNLLNAEVYCNRGTSGIDGSISTAVGNAIGSGKQVWVISGDLSFQYDGNALWNGFVPKDLRIVVINNSGGGIFRLIDGPSSVPELGERFETQTQSSAQYKAAQHGLDYFACTHEQQMDQVWSDFTDISGSAKILEIFTDPAANETIFKTFQKQLSNTI